VFRSNDRSLYKVEHGVEKFASTSGMGEPGESQFVRCLEPRNGTGFCTASWRRGSPSHISPPLLKHAAAPAISFSPLCSSLRSRDGRSRRDGSHASWAPGRCRRQFTGMPGPRRIVGLPAEKGSRVAGSNVDTADKPKDDDNDQYQAENAAESRSAIPTITMVATEAAEQQDHQDDK
jgi:hypothetical protein